MNDINKQLQAARAEYKKFFDCMQNPGRPPTNTQWAYLDTLADKVDELEEIKRGLE